MSHYEVTKEDLQHLSLEQIEGGYTLYDKVSFRHWETLLNKWIDTIKKFCSETNGEPPYQDNEMGNVGLLMSAAWLVGGIAETEKPVKLENANKKNERTKRLDLWMKLPNSGIEEFIEAKYTNYLGKPKKDGSPDKYDYTSLKEELFERCGNLKITNNQRAVAILFLARNFKIKYKDNFFKKYKDSPSVEEKINGLLKEELVNKDWDILAWCFPKKMKNKNHPGIILSAKHIKAV